MPYFKTHIFHQFFLKQILSNRYWYRIAQLCIQIRAKSINQSVLCTNFNILYYNIFRKSKWLLCGTYHPPAQNDQYFFNCIDKALDTYSNYDNVLLAGDFNAEDDEPCLSNFLYQHDLYNLVKVGTCFKNSSKPTSIDLFLTTKNTHFQNTVAVCSI